MSGCIAAKIKALTEILTTVKSVFRDKNLMQMAFCYKALKYFMNILQKVFSFFSAKAGNDTKFVYNHKKMW